MTSTRQACPRRQNLARAPRTPLNRGSGRLRAAFRFLVPAIVLATAACVDERAGDMTGATTSVDTVAGVVHVVNTGTAPEWELALVASIGPESAMEEGTPRAFGAVSSVTFGPDGAVFVADRLNREVRVFAEDGAHLRTFGREGEGPGEFGTLASLHWTGSKLLALDFSNGRTGELSAEGEWLGQRAEFGGITGGQGRLRFYPVATGRAYVLTYAPERGAMVFAGHDDAGPTTDTIPALDPPEGTVSAIRCASAMAIRSYSIPFAPSIVQHPGPGGVLHSVLTTDYAIAATRGADTLRVVRRELPAEPVTDPEWEAGNEPYRNFIDENPSADCEPRRPERPAVKPFVEALFVAPGGRLWVEVVRDAGNRWEVFDADGALVGGLPALDRTVALAFGPERLAAVRRDSLGVDRVEVHRVVEGSGGR